MYTSFLQTVILLRCVCVILMLTFNAVMWALFVRALQYCSSTVEVAAVNTASNFFFTVSTLYLSAIISSVDIEVLSKGLRMLSVKLNH